MKMDYESKINELMTNYQHPCDAEIPPGSYRRVVFWGHAENYPAVGVEWDTEIVAIGTHLYTREPFGNRSTDLPPINAPVPDPVTGAVPVGILVPKIGYYFSTQAEVDSYIKSIGATKIDGANDWYGADLTKSSLYKHPGELAMYRVENSGGYMTASGARADARLRQAYVDATGAYTAVDYYWNGDRIAYMKHSETHNCKYVGMRVNSNADTSIPPVPPSVPSSYGSLPGELKLNTLTRMAVSRASSISCIPASAGFPYTNIADAMLSAWNETRDTFKLHFDMLSGTPKGSIFDGLSISMEELTLGAVAFSQQAWQAAMKAFRQVVDSAFNIVGGAFDLIKNFLPVVTILGVSVNISDLVFGDNSVDVLKQAFSDIIASGKKTYAEVIDEIYSFIGSSYEYSVEYVKAGARDLVDACSELFDWCITMYQNAAVALVDLYGRMMQIWAMPPTVPNPLWSAVLAIRNILRQIKPLDVILGGNFPGFTASDLYHMAQEKVKVFIDQSYEQIRGYYEQGKAVYENMTAQTAEKDAMKRKFEQYKRNMWETVKDETTKAYETSIAAAEQAIEQTKVQYEAIKEQIVAVKDSMKDTYSLAMDQLKKLPVMAKINEFLGYCGVAFDDVVKTYHNAVTGAQSLYKDFVDSSRSFKDTCKIIYNQICTLALSKVTQYINKLLSLIGLNVSFPAISICVPVVRY